MYPAVFLFANLFILFGYSHSSNLITERAADAVCPNAPEGYTVLDVVSLLKSQKLPNGITREKLPSEYDVYTIDRSLKQYRKLLLCVNGHPEQCDTPALNTLVHKKLGNSEYLALVDKLPMHLREFDDSCRFVRGFVVYDAEFDYDVPKDRIKRIGSVSFMHKQASDRLYELSFIPCDALVDPVNGNYPKHSTIAAYNQDADMVDLYGVAVDDLVFTCGPDSQHHFRVTEFSKLFRYEHDGYKYVALGEIRPDNLLIPAICKYGGKEPPAMKGPKDQEFLSALTTLIPNDINIPRIVDVLTGKVHDKISHLLTHGVTYKKLTDKLHQLDIDRFVLRTPLVLMDNFALSIGVDPKVETLFLILPAEDEVDVFKYNIILGKVGDLEYQDDIKVAYAYSCDVNSKVQHVAEFNFPFPGSNKRISAPVLEYFADLPKRGSAMNMPFLSSAYFNYPNKQSASLDAQTAPITVAA